MKSSSGSTPKSNISTARKVVSNKRALGAVFDREPGKTSKIWKKYQKKHALLIGAGGLGGFIGLGLVRKAIGRLTICDGDIVETSNLNRQRFRPSDIGKNKAKALARNLKTEVIASTVIRGIDLYFEEALEEGLIETPDICVCMPDNDEVRALAARYCLLNEIPMVTAGLSQDSDYGYVFLQSSTKSSACWGCYGSSAAGKVPCGARANINLPMISAGLILTACDSIVSGNEIQWNFRRFSLSGEVRELCAVIKTSSDCRICSK